MARRMLDALQAQHETNLTADESARAGTCGHLGTFAASASRLMMVAQPSGIDPPPARPLLFYRSVTLSRGAALVLPAFDSNWFGGSGAGRQVLIVVALAAVAIGALLVAGAAYLNDQRRTGRRRGEDDDLFTTTPLPLSADEIERHSRGSPHHAFTGLRIPRWVQAGSLVVALGITWTVAQRLRPNDQYADAAASRARAIGAGQARPDPEETPEDLDLTPDSNPAFAFRVRDWIARDGGGCAGRLEVTKGQPSPYTLTARVHDNRGQLLDTARARVPTLREGEVVEFSFPRADCDRIGAWDVRGAKASP